MNYVVLGCKELEESVSRASTCLMLIQDGDTITVSGTVRECKVMKNVIMRSERIQNNNIEFHMEEDSHNTVQNIVNTYNMIGDVDTIVITSQYHSKRVELILDKLHLDNWKVTCAKDKNQHKNIISEFILYIFDIVTLKLRTHGFRK